MFQREYEIVRLVAHHAETLWPDFRGERVLQAERGYGRGVADLVVLDINRIHLADRRERLLPPARRAGEAAVLEAVIAHGGEPLDNIARHAVQSQRTVSAATFASFRSIPSCTS